MLYGELLRKGLIYTPLCVGTLYLQGTEERITFNYAVISLLSPEIVSAIVVVWRSFSGTILGTRVCEVYDGVGLESRVSVDIYTFLLGLFNQA